jgi:hypothetical protein
MFTSFPSVIILLRSGQAVLSWELFLISGICARLNFSKVPDLNHVDHVRFSAGRLTIARILAGRIKSEHGDQ